MHLSLISAGLLPLNFSISPSREALRPSDVPKSATTALISALVPGSILAFARSVPLAKLSFRRPHSPLGSAAVTAIPAAITLSERTFHSSGVKFDLSVMSIDSSFLENVTADVWGAKTHAGDLAAFEAPDWANDMTG